MMNARFGDDLVDHYTYVICGDGCLMEGISHEAIDLAGHLKLNKLIVLFDDNGISIDGKTNLSTSTDQVARFKAAGWDSWHVDGHDVDAIRAAIEKAKTSDKPVMIACKTVIGYGSPKLAGSEKSHGAPLGDEEIAATRKALLWESEPFVIPDAVMKGWRAIAEKNKERRAEWEKRHAAHARKAEFDATVACELPADFAEAMAAYRQKLSDESPKLATRKSSEATLEVINAMTPLTIGGSADLTHSVFTLTKGMASVQADDYGGRYIHYGIREHAMAAVMNGLALHGGFIPYGGTFLVFSDYMRGAMRLSALMGQRVIYVLTHDSIGLGEDGPTHQPVEHLAMLRATPNINVFRPADAIETAEAWEIALTSTDRPTVLSLSRQNLPTVRAGDVAENRSKRGAYVLREAEGGARQVTLIATGSEIEIALAAADKLKGEGIAAAVVSAPCLDLFAEQDAGYRAEVLGTAPRVAVEAAIGFGWERWIGDNGRFIGMHGFGASGPAPKLYEKFGITADAVAKAARELI
jgi:transketolase